MTARPVDRIDCLILGYLEAGEVSGITLREALATDWHVWLTPDRFYSRMATLEDEGHVEGFWVEVTINEQPHRGRAFRLRKHPLQKGGQR